MKDFHDTMQKYVYKATFKGKEITRYNTDQFLIDVGAIKVIDGHIFAQPSYARYLQELEEWRKWVWINIPQKIIKNPKFTAEEDAFEKLADEILL